jgi:hypothetical protein
MLAGAAAVCAGLVPVAVAVTPPTGDVAAANFFGRKAAEYASLPGAKMVVTGYFFVKPGTGTSVNYRWAQPRPPGYTPATATVLEWLSGGKIDAYLATLTAPKVRSVRILLAGGDVFVSSTRCWRKADASYSPFGTGERYLFNDGGAKFQPLALGAGGSTVVTYSYQWVPGATATQVDTFTSGKPARVSTDITVTGKQTLHVHKSITPLETAPELPVQPPSRPVPKPRCSR